VQRTVMQGGGGATRCNMTTSQQTGALREQEEAVEQEQGQHDNQLANKRQTGGEASADRRRQSVKRMRGSGSTTRGILTTSWQTRGKKRGGAGGPRGSGVLKAGGTSRQQEVEVAQ
jgi:hypothetical protein